MAAVQLMNPAGNLDGLLNQMLQILVELQPLVPIDASIHPPDIHALHELTRGAKRYLEAAKAARNQGRHIELVNAHGRGYYWAVWAVAAILVYNQWRNGIPPPPLP